MHDAAEVSLESDSSAVTRVLIVEDHRLVADLLTKLVDAEDDLQVVGWAETIAETYELVERGRPDVVLMDYQLPDGTGTKCAEALKEAGAEAMIIMLTGRDRGRVVAEAIEAGCSGFFTKTDRLEEIIDAIRTVRDGGSAFSQNVLSQVVEHMRRPKGGPTESLTGREREVLRLLAQGRTTEQMAEELYLSQHTVRNHVRNLTMKLDAHSKLEAVVVGVREGLIDLEDFAD